MKDDMEELPAEPPADRLKLPEGAFVAFRQSGGLRFRTREMIVYHDGHVIVRREGRLERRTTARLLTPAEVADLKGLILGSGFFELHPLTGRPNPDGYAYELAVCLGRQSSTVELFEGNLPLEVQALLARLKALASGTLRLDETQPHDPAE